MTQLLSRRSFLKTSGIVLGAGAAACCGLTTLAVQSPETVLTESHYGAASTSSKVLVAYATRCGSTIEIAQAIAQTIGRAAAGVDVLPVKNVTGIHALQPYRAVIVGSAIRRGNWLAEASDFVARYREVLAKMPVAYFTACMTLRDDTPESRQQVAAYVGPVRAVLEPQAEAFFAGKFDPNRVSVVERLMLQMVGTPAGDFRNWQAVGNWAAELPF
ncbi:MAG: flavodoxin domain-containing protein [Chloroflexota bacterium]